MIFMNHNFDGNNDDNLKVLVKKYSVRNHLRCSPEKVLQSARLVEKRKKGGGGEA